MLCLKGIKLRMYPTKGQEEKLEQMFGNDLWLWNAMLAMGNERYHNNPSLPRLSKYAMDRLLKTLKLEHDWLKKSDSKALQEVCANLDKAWQRFFEDKTRRAGKPRFHGKRFARKSYGASTTQVKLIDRRHMYLPKLKSVRTSRTGQLDGLKIKHYTVTKAPTGKYWLSITVDVPEMRPLQKTGKSIGIDAGIESILTYSTGDKIPSFDAQWEEKQAIVWQRKFNRRKNGAKQSLQGSITITKRIINSYQLMI